MQKVPPRGAAHGDLAFTVETFQNLNFFFISYGCIDIDTTEVYVIMIAEEVVGSLLCARHCAKPSP